MGRTTRVATSIVGTMIAIVLVFGVMLVGRAGASDAYAAPMQATATATTTGGTTGGTAATATATTTGGTTGGTATTATAGTTGGTTGGTAATATATAPGNLPNTGGESNLGLLFMGAAALLVLGIAVSGVLALRRGQAS